MSMKRAWQIGNILSLVFALIANFVVGAQLLSLPGINEISDKYATLLTPAAYAFSIWSLIYTLLIVFTVYQARDIIAQRKENDLPQKTGPYFIIANICNGIWTYVFVNELVGLSVVILLVLTASLYILLSRLRIAVYDAPLRVIACVWWPLLIYTGWVTVATVVNIASWFVALGIVVSSAAACFILISLLFGLIILLIVRNVRELVLASAWGIFAIGIQQTYIANDMLVASVAFAVSGALLGAVVTHAYMNRRASALNSRTSM